jgi:hypothetical protein
MRRVSNHLTPCFITESYHNPASLPPSAQRDAECDVIFKYNSSQANFTTSVLPPSEPPSFERTRRVYCDSQIEDPVE